MTTISRFFNPLWLIINFNYKALSGKLQTRLFAVLSLLLITVTFSYNALAQTTVTVTQNNMQNWLFYNDENDTIDNSLGSFVTGPGTAPSGTGSVQISVSGTQRRNLATYQFSGTPLASITTLKFSLYNPSAGNGGPANRTGFLHFNVDFNGSDTWQRRLIFEPNDNGAVIQNSWQEWDAINGGNGVWRYSGGTFPGGGITKTWSQILADYPGVRIRVTDAFMGIRVGSPYNDGYTENIDAFKFGTSSGTTTFNFDPSSTLQVDDDLAQCPSAGFTTIQSAVNAANPGDIIQVCNGTYIEDVLVNKSDLTLNGANNTSTIISGAIGGDGATVRIGASNVTVANFTITRQGNNTTDWNNSGLNFAGIAIQGQATTNALIRNNIFVGNRTGIDINDSSGHTIRNNIIDFNRTGLLFRNRTDNLTFVENFVRDNWTVGILFLDASGGTNSPLQQALNSKFNNNNISGNWYGQVVDRQSGGSLPAPGTTNLKNFRFNWWGTTNPVVTTANSAEPGYAVQIPVAYGGTATAPGGQPDIAGPASANIKFMPVLQSGTDTNVETTAGRGVFGFQGAPGVITVKPSMLNGWSQVAQRTATGSFVVGPGTPPLNFGSYRMTTGAGNAGPDLPQGGAGQGGKVWLTTQQYDNTRLADITQMGFSTYVTASPASSGNIITPTLQFQIDLDGNGTRDSAMIFEPYYSTVANGGTQPNVSLGQWQTWDARGGKWWFNNATVFGCGGCVFPTFNAIIAAYPNAKILTWYPLADGYGTQFVAGQNSAGAPWMNFDGNVDAFTIAVNAPSTTFDFEPGRPSVTINQANSQADPTSSSPINFTVTFSEPVTGFDASDVVLGGTAGATTAVVSGSGATYNVAVSGMTGSGTVTASVVDSAATANSNSAPSTASTSTDNTVTFFTCNNVSAPSGMTALTGTVLTVPINTDSLNGRGVSSFDFTFSYNSSVLSFNSFDQSGTLSSGMTITVNSATPGSLIVSGFSANDLIGSGTLIKLKFNVNGAIGTTSPLGFSSFLYNEGVPCVVTTAGSFSVISGTISGVVTYLNSATTRPVPGTLLTASGAVVVTDTTDVNGLYDLSGLGNSAYTVTPSKSGDVMGAITSLDASQIAQHVVGISPFNPGGGAFQSADVTGNGTITSLDAAYIARYVALFTSGTGSTGTWRFVPASRSYSLAQVQTGASNENYAAILMGDVTGSWGGASNPTRPNVREEDLIGVNAPNMSIKSAADVVIPVELRNLNRKDIVSYQFELAFSQKVIQPTANPCDVLNTVSKDLTVVCNAETPGLLRVVVFGVSPLDGDGILLNLRFTAVGSAGAVSPLTLRKLMFNEGEPQLRATDGEIKISEPSADTDSIKGQ